MKSKYAGLAFLSFLFSLVNAQEKLPSDTFRVVKEYQPTLIDANKISFEPVIDDSLKIDLDLNYTFINKQVPVSFELEPIPPAKIKGEPLIKLYNGYARLGVGNALVPFGEVYYTNLRSKKFASGVHASYLNMAEVNNMKGSDMDKMHLEVFGKRFWKTNTLDARLGFDRHAFNYYGYYRIPGATGASELPNSDLEQYYNKFSASATLASTKKKKVPTATLR